MKKKRRKDDMGFGVDPQHSGVYNRNQRHNEKTQFYWTNKAANKVRDLASDAKPKNSNVPYNVESTSTPWWKEHQVKMRLSKSGHCSREHRKSDGTNDRTGWRFGKT